MQILYMSSRKPCSSERVPRTLTDGMLTEQHRTDKERIQNRNGMDTERIQNGYGTDTEREQECEWNGNRTCSVKRSLLGFFWLVLYWVVGQEHFGHHFHDRCPQKSSQHVRAYAAHDGTICYKNSKILPYHRDRANARNGASLRSLSQIMAPGWSWCPQQTEQSLFCSEIRGEEHNEGSKTSVTASVTCKGQAVKPQAVSSTGGSQLRISRSHAHDPSLACVAFFVFLPMDFRAKERLLSVLVLNQDICL